jgi:hypothetical protein
MDYSRVNTVTQVGDTLIVKYQYFKGTDVNGNDMPDATLYQFDIQHNNKLLDVIENAWQPTSNSSQKAVNTWNGYKFTIDSEKDQTDFDGQYLSWLSGDATYGTNADWSVQRVTYQDVTSLETGAEIMKVYYKIKDKANSNYTDYTNLINVNWANYKEADGTQIDVTGQSNIGLTGIQGGDAGNVSISVSSNVITNNIGDGSDFSYSIITKEDMDDGDPTNDVIVASGTFDAAGDATVTGLENDIEYAVFISIDDSKEYLDNAVTVSDLALIFQEAIGAGDSPNGSTTTFDYYVQKLLGDVYFPQGDGPFTINFQDSYEVLAYLQGVTSTNTTYITKTGGAFNVSGIKSTFGDKAETTDYPTFSPIIKPTDNDKSFQFAHALGGDVNFSHGFEPTSTNADIPTSAQSTTTQRSMMVRGAKLNPETANLELTSELQNGQVVFTIGSQVTDMIGAQFNITYDKTRLVLDNVVFDTGNEMTNFSNHLEESGKVNIGSFDQNFEANIKTGTPYKLIFIPIVELQNTSGLITFKVNEGVKADGTQIKFIMD